MAIVPHRSERTDRLWRRRARSQRQNPEHVRDEHRRYYDWCKCGHNITAHRTQTGSFDGQCHAIGCACERYERDESVEV